MLEKRHNTLTQHLITACVISDGCRGQLGVTSISRHLLCPAESFEINATPLVSTEVYTKI